ncbi:MAG: CoA transferase [Blastocatellia bacterium]|nr:CoA transferase [Blastocatellia bacterium]
MIADSTNTPPLAGLTVLDLTTALAGPFATLLLAGLGARVIKIENPHNPDSCRTNAPYLSATGAKLAREAADDISISAINRLRNKLGITLNLKDPRGRETFNDLLPHADVVVENFSAGVMDRLDIGYDVARQINPRIIYCSISGFGCGNPGGEPSSGKAMDTIIQALSGIMETSGAQADPPVRIGVPIADLITPLFGIIGILAALQKRQQTGVGQHVDVSMLGVMTSLVACEPFDLLQRLGVPTRTGLTAPRLAPFGLYQASDGYIALCAPTEAFARNLFAAMERPELAEDERFRTRDQRVKHVAEIDAIVSAWMRPRTCDELLARLDATGTPAARVRSPQEAVCDPLVVGRGDTVPLAHPQHGLVEEVYGIGMPIHFSDSRAGFDQPPPAPGEHNLQIYGDLLGYSAERIAALRALGVI